MSVIQMKDIAVRLLTPNDTLDVRIFDSHGKIEPDESTKNALDMGLNIFKYL